MHLHLYATSWFTLVFEYIYTQQAGSRLYLYLHATTWFTIVFVFTRHKLVHACTCIYTQQAGFLLVFEFIYTQQPGSRLYFYLFIRHNMIHAHIFISTPQPGFRSYLYLHATSWFMLVFVFTHHNLVHACICIYIHATTGHNRPQPGS